MKRILTILAFLSVLLLVSGCQWATVTEFYEYDVSPGTVVGPGRHLHEHEEKSEGPPSESPPNLFKEVTP